MGEIVLEILNGKSPAEIPVRFMTEKEDSDILFDLDAAKNCGIEIPSDLLENATMIIKDGVLTENTPDASSEK